MLISLQDVKKFVKETWFKLGTLLGLLLICLFGIYYFMIFTKHNDIYAQENCSKKAEGIYSKNKDSNVAWLGGSNYTNHFNKKINKCLVLIKGGDLSIEHHSALYDAYENKELGVMHALMDMAVACHLEIDGSYKECKSTMVGGGATSAWMEFNNLVGVYMEN